jgi:hypothetical protein
MPCPTLDGCGIVEAGPISSLGTDQYVDINMYSFTPGDTIGIFYCKDSGSLATPPICILEPLGTYPSPEARLAIPSSGTVDYSFESQSVSTASTPLCGLIPTPTGSQHQVPTTYPCGYSPPGGAGTGGVQTPPGSPFWCDNGPNNCSIDVTDESLTNQPLSSPKPTNTVVLPLNFYTPSTACASADLLTSESEFGFQQLFDATDPVTCAQAGANAKIPFDTSLDGTGALEALASGSTQVAFTDDPQSPEQQAIIKAHHYLLIPLALSANAIAYRSVEKVGYTPTPYASLKLTARMVAQIIAGAEHATTDIDPAACGAYTCSIYYVINSQGTFEADGNVTAFLRSDHAGPIGQALDWICAMPAVTEKLLVFGSTVEAKEASSPEEVLKAALFQPGGPSAPDECVSSDQLPGFSPLNPNWTALSTVDLENLKLSETVPAYNQAGGESNTGIATMSLAVADYYGMPSAAVQNAAGQFVAPSEASVLAGISDGTWNGTGMFTPSYSNTTDAAAYGMPSVMYAAVPTDDISSSDTAQLKGMLSSILAQTTGTSANGLPAGLYALPAKVAAMAESEVSDGIDNPSYVAELGGSPQSSSSASSSSPFADELPLGGLSAGTSTTGGGSTSHAETTTSQPTPSSSPDYGPFDLTASESHLIVAMTVGGGIVFGLIGLGLLLAAWLLGRRLGRGATLAADEADEVGEAGPPGEVT